MNETDWQAEVLTELGELQANEYDDINAYLIDTATTIAFVVCEKGQRFSVLEMISIGGRTYDGYRIVFANPLGSEMNVRHGASEVGTLDGKLALIKALQDGRSIVVNNVASDPLTAYLGQHIERKELRHMAVVPCGTEPKRYLLVFDKVSSGCDTPFSDEELSFFDRAARIISSGVRHHLREQETRKRAVSKKNNELLNVLDHRIKNPLTIIGGFGGRLRKALDQNDHEKALSYVRIVLTASERLTKDLELEKEIRSFLDPNSNDQKDRTYRELSSYLSAFDEESFQIDDTLIRDTFMLNHSERLVSQLFDRVRSFMLGNRTDHDLAVHFVSRDLESLTIAFKCSGFKHFKETFDENLFCISGIADALGGSVEVGDDVLHLTLPVSIRSLEARV